MNGHIKENLAMFNLIAESITQCFGRIHQHTMEHIEENKEFLKSNLVKMWCDCSDNFEPKKLQKLYEQHIKFYYKHYEMLELQTTHKRLPLEEKSILQW